MANKWPITLSYQNRTDFGFTVERVVMGVKIPLKAISHLFSMLNLNFGSIFDESQRLACTVHTKLAKIPKNVRIFVSMLKLL